MNVLGANVDALQVFIHLFGHALGKGGYQYTPAIFNTFIYFVQQIIYLIDAGAYFYWWFYKAGRSNDLFYYYTFAFFQLIFSRCGAHKNNLRHQSLKLIEVQWSVVQCRWQPEPKVYQIHLARPIPAIHAAYLRNGHMAFIYNQQEVIREIVQQAEWSCAGFASVQKSGVVFYTTTVAQFLYHFQVIAYSFPYTLCFYQFALFLEVFFLGGHFILNLMNDLSHLP